MSKTKDPGPCPETATDKEVRAWIRKNRAWQWSAEYRRMHPEWDAECHKVKALAEKMLADLRNAASQKKKSLLLNKLIAHEKSARAIGSIHEADAYALKIEELGGKL